MLVAFAAAPELGTSAVMFYAASYAAMNVGAFAVVSHFANAGEATYPTRLWASDAAPILGRRPQISDSLIEFPSPAASLPSSTSSAALKSDLVWLTIIGVVNSAIGAYYYLKIIVVMYMREPREEVPVLPVPPALTAALAITLAATIYLGVLPGRILDFAQRSARQLVHSDVSTATGQIDGVQIFQQKR